MLTTSRLEAPEPTFRELFTPKLVTVLREGYGFKTFQADALSGLTVAIVALPPSMAIAPNMAEARAAARQAGADGDV